MEKTMDSADVKLSVKEKVAFGMGDLYSAGAQGLIGAVYMVFLVLNGIEPGLAATIIMVSKLWDAVTDPTMGIISDNTRTKWGRRRPYLFAGSFCIIVSFAALFLPLYAWQSGIGKFIVYLMSFLLYNTVSTMINIPYFSLATEMTSNYYEKNKMNNIRQIFSSLSSAISAGVPIVLLERLQDGKITLNVFSFIMVVGFGIFYGGTLIFTAIICRERLPLPSKKSEFNIREALKPVHLKAFVYLMLMYLCAFSCMDLITTNIVWFADYALNFGYSAFILLVIIMVCYVAMIPFHATMMKRNKPKAFLFRMGIPLYVFGIVCLCLYPAGWSDIGVLLLGALVGIGMSGCQLMPWYIFPDVVDIGELKYGERNTGSYSGIMTFVRKITAAIAIGISGWILQLSGFQKPVTDFETGLVTKFVQTQGAIWGLRLVIMVPILILLSVAFIASVKLKLTPARSVLVSKVNAAQGRTDALSDAELEQLEIVKIKLF